MRRTPSAFLDVFDLIWRPFGLADRVDKRAAQQLCRIEVAYKESSRRLVLAPQ